MTDAGATAPGDAGRPRRQARGQQRIEQILHAAAVVFAERGYEAATTNAIAQQAGISPGSLYQFFKNKDDVAGALARHYAARLSELRTEVFARPDLDRAGLDELVSALLGPLVAFNLDHPGFKALFARTDMPDGLRDAVDPAHEAIHRRVAELVGQRMPHLPRDDVARVATVTIQLVRGMIPLIARAVGDERDVLTAELHAVVVGYLRGHAA